MAWELEFKPSLIWQESSGNHMPKEQTLREEVEMERQRAAVLVAALNSAKQERDAAMQKLRELSPGSPRGKELTE